MVAEPLEKGLGEDIEKGKADPMGSSNSVRLYRPFELDML